MAAFNIAASVLLITAQRLAEAVRELQGPGRLSSGALLKAGLPEDLDGNRKPFRAVGCSMCSNGYKGRVGIYQVMPISEEIQRIIWRPATRPTSRVAQREGYATSPVGLLKVRRHTTPKS